MWPTPCRRTVEAGRERQRGVRTESEGQRTSDYVTSRSESKRTEKMIGQLLRQEITRIQDRSSSQFNETSSSTSSSEEETRTSGNKVGGSR